MRTSTRTSAVHALLAVVLTLFCSVTPAIVFTTAASAAPSTTSTTATASSHSGLRCRSHYAETHGPSGRVNVPKSYCYDPTTTTHRGWHDYCTHSPDSYFSADFRGPCARHDMCLQAGKGHHTCDAALLDNLYHNCNYAYGRFNPVRYTCQAIAQEYYGYIKIYTAVS